MTNPAEALEYAREEKIKELEAEVKKLKEENMLLSCNRSEVVVLEKERDHYYKAFDILTAKLGLFRKVDPAYPKEAFKYIYKKFKRQKAKVREYKNYFCFTGIAVHLGTIDDFLAGKNEPDKNGNCTYTIKIIIPDRTINIEFRDWRQGELVFLMLERAWENYKKGEVK